MPIIAPFQTVNPLKEKRRHIPLGFLSLDILCSNLVKLIPDATLYHFGVLTSGVIWLGCVLLQAD